MVDAQRLLEHSAKLADSGKGGASLAEVVREFEALNDILGRIVSYASLLSLPGAGEPVADAKVAEQVEIATKYAGHLERQNEQIARDAAQETLRLPTDIDYRTVRGLSTEVQQKLNQYRPETLGHAARISGMTPAAIALLLVHLKRGFQHGVPEASQRSA